MVEMNLGIIASSLVVMRPCFQAIRDLIFGVNVTETSRGTKGRSYVISSDGGKLSSRVSRRDTTIIRTTTVDVQMESRSVSTEDILRGKDQF